MVRGQMVPGKIVPGKLVPGKWSPENWSPEKWPSKIVLRQKNARKFERLLIFIDWFHYTYKKMFDVHFTILHALNESRKVCYRVLGFYRLIISQHSTHTHTRAHTHTHHDARRSPHDSLFLSFPGPFFRGSIF